ncbi:hypothetical protein JN531_001305 [Flagellatimonas centrodinii]|uniref:hypothetical protein n=1 Tax=Flagellatimonas centrodinii TaxID=2806210 RepID=UPI001FEFF7AA|nr:hypothetical protein [Flagellatimonas centrodinii]ULQ46935.1 hypothetical protein JN531_001305 [Flagellatimonas centrodinii]
MAIQISGAASETAKLTPPVVALLTEATADQIIAVLTIAYLVILLGHKLWSWRNEHGDRRERRSGRDRRGGSDRRNPEDLQ